MSTGGPLSGAPTPHGTNNGYRNYGCRCDACVEAGRSYQLAWKRSRHPEIYCPRTDIPGERWVPMVEVDGDWLISDYGRVVHSKRPGVVLDLETTSNGYLVLSRRNGRFAIHRAVARAFHGPKPFPEAVARHLNDVRTDNRAVNISWGTYSQNMHDRTRNGRDPNANRTHCNYGHEYSQVKNVSKNGVRRRCLTCHRERERARNQAKRAQAAA